MRAELCFHWVQIVIYWVATKWRRMTVAQVTQGGRELTSCMSLHDISPRVKGLKMSRTSEMTLAPLVTVHS